MLGPGDLVWIPFIVTTGVVGCGEGTWCVESFEFTLSPADTIPVSSVVIAYFVSRLVQSYVLPQFMNPINTSSLVCVK